MKKNDVKIGEDYGLHTGYGLAKHGMNDCVRVRALAFQEREVRIRRGYPSIASRKASGYLIAYVGDDGTLSTTDTRGNHHWTESRRLVAPWDKVLEHRLEEQRRKSRFEAEYNRNIDTWKAVWPKLLEAGLVRDYERVTNMPRKGFSLSPREAEMIADAILAAREE